MAYKFQKGLARLDGTIALDAATDKFQLSGSIELADNSLDVAELNVNGGSDLGNNVASGDLLVIADASDSNAVKKVSMLHLSQFLSGSDPTFAQVSGALSGADAQVGFGHQDLLDIDTITTVGAISAGGSVTAVGSFIIGSACLLYTSPSPRDATLSRMPSSA